MESRGQASRKDGNRQLHENSTLVPSKSEGEADFLKPRRRHGMAQLVAVNGIEQQKNRRHRRRRVWPPTAPFFMPR